MFKVRRTQGWGVDPFRMTTHMTSSQTLLVNLLGPLGANRQWLLRALGTVLARPDFVELLNLEIEYAPRARSRYLGDMTRLDALITVRTAGGIEGVVLELKYTDRFSSRKLPIAENPLYRQMANDSDTWRTPTSALTDYTVSQLLRCHALGTKALQVEHSAWMPVTLLLVSHPLDLVAVDILKSYRDHLSAPASAVHVDLAKFLNAAIDVSSNSLERAAMGELQLRYIEHAESEDLWLEHSSMSYAKNF
ncbi:hypothetical protein IFU30_12345 [Plantibacter sp. CFBP 8798]|nr:hypothetical protein [Plantibacter sp. CFBP 8798]MBD8467059.1 hypothetical protein [Plantibacter sp. CFBP 8798]